MPTYGPLYFLVAAVVIGVGWKIAERVGNPRRRRLARALLVAVATCPTILAGGHGAGVGPAWYGVWVYSQSQTYFHLVWLFAVAPILVATVLLWALMEFIVVLRGPRGEGDSTA